MNEQNLRPLHQSNEEATRNGKKGGIASGKARRQRKAIKTAILEAIYAETEAGSTELEEMIGGMIRRVKKTGDAGTFEKIMEYAGKSPKSRREDEELQLRKAQLEQKSGDVTDIEDLRALAEMINEPDADD
ncbi:MAG: hypothetical protein IJI07_01210 [Flexilinea sp.]|nr:hypothetical protein [Flexilinea sp.]